jgi:hypothetical protein
MRGDVFSGLWTIGLIVKEMAEPPLCIHAQQGVLSMNSACYQFSIFLIPKWFLFS